MRGSLKTLLWFSPCIICASFPLGSPPLKMCHIPLHKFGYAKLARRVLRVNMLQALLFSSLLSYPHHLTLHSLPLYYFSFTVCPCRGKCRSLTLGSCLEYPLPHPLHSPLYPMCTHTHARTPRTHFEKR